MSDCARTGAGAITAPIVKTHTTNTIIQSWDTGGYGSKPTVTEPTAEANTNGNGGISINWGLVILIIFLILIVIVVIVVVAIVIVKKSGEVEEGPGVEIVARGDFSDVTFLLEFSHPMMAKAARPGQFVIVIPHEHGERIPLTIAISCVESIS